MKKLLCILSILSLVPMAAFADVVDAFPDVEESHTYYESIEYVRLAGLVNGNSDDGTFTPDNTLNRAEMLKILVLAGGATETEILPYATEECFSDVPAETWFTGYVCFGKDKGYIKGYGDNTFKPAQAVTFVEGMKIAYEAFGLDWTENEAPDVWFKDLAGKAADAKYIPPTISSFDQDLLRGEMADLAARIHSDASSETGLTDYLASLGTFGDIVPTYETIENGEDLSEMDAVEIEPGEDEEDDQNVDPDPEPVDPNASKIADTVFYQSKLNPLKWIGFNMVFLENKDSDEVLAEDHTYITSDDEYAYYYFWTGCLDEICSNDEAADKADIESIAATFTFGGIAGDNVYAQAHFGFYIQTTVWGAVEAVEFQSIDDALGKNYVIINITAQGFDSAAQTIAEGDTVLFVNTDSAAHWPASDNHPTHTSYPGSDINNCGGETAIFDACEGLVEGATFEFTFNEVGTWTYHDHLDSGTTGTITVEALVVL
jgi:plastocyanin